MVLVDNSSERAERVRARIEAAGAGAATVALCDVGMSADVVRVARLVAPSKSVAWPVGSVPAPLTSMVKVTGWPTSVGLPVDVTTTLGAEALTVCDTVVDVLAP